MQIGLIPLPSGALAAAQAAQKRVPQPGDPDYIWPLKEIEGSATRDYFPAMLAALAVALAFTDKRGKKR